MLGRTGWRRRQRARGQVTSGPPLLAKAAAQAVKHWRYQPFELNGKPVSMHNQITIQFKLP